MSFDTTPDRSAYKIIVVGNFNVGKTSMINRYCGGNFVEYYKPTVGIDLKKKTINFNDKTILLNIWDTAGTEKYRSLVQLYYRGAVGLFLVYDVSNLESFYDLHSWMKSISDYAPPYAVKILIGNKCDSQSDKMVSTEEGQAVSEHFGIPFFEVSSKNNVNISESFSKMVSMIHEIEVKNQIEKEFVVLQNDLDDDDTNTPSKCTCPI